VEHRGPDLDASILTQELPTLADKPELLHRPTAQATSRVMARLQMGCMAVIP
jgi:hypothetical protein